MYAESKKFLGVNLTTVMALSFFIFAVTLLFFQEDLQRVTREPIIQIFTPETPAVKIKTVPARITCRNTKNGRVCTA